MADFLENILIGIRNWVNGKLEYKQDVIGDLDEIRSGASLGATALQEVPSGYVSEIELDIALSGKADADHTHTIEDVSGLTETLDEYSEVIASHIVKIEDTLSAHTADTISHVTSAQTEQWDAAQENVIEEVQVNGSALTISGKSVNVIIPEYQEGDYITISGDSIGVSAELQATISANTNAINEIGFEELAYDENAFNTQFEDDVKALGVSSKLGKKVSLYVCSADTISGQSVITYALPYAANELYLPLINSDGMREYNGITFKIEVSTEVVSGSATSSLQLTRYDNGTASDWSADETVAFKLEYIAI